MRTFNWPNRLYTLDISRAIASLAVIICHWSHFCYQGTILNEELPIENFPFYKTLKLFYLHGGGGGVQYFFMLSGFVFFWIYYESISNFAVNFRSFFISRFSRLYPLHFLTLILVLILQLIYFSIYSTYFVYQNNDLYHFILNLFFISHWGFQEGWSFNGPVWSVSIEILLYFLFFLVAIKRIGSLKFCFIISILSFLIMSFFSNHSIFVGLTSFFLGGVLYRLLKIVPFQYAKYRYLIYTICISSWVGVLTHFYLIEIDNNLIDFSVLGKSLRSPFCTYILFPSTIASLTIFEISQNLKNIKSTKSIKSWAWIGDLTYSSYLLHFPLQLICVIFASSTYLNSNFYLKRWFFISFLAILIPISYLTFLKFEKPVQAFLRKRLKHRRKKNILNSIKNKILHPYNNSEF